MENNFYDLTAPQKSIWLTEQYYKNTNINNVCGTFYSNEKIDFELLKKSINIFLKNNNSFKIKLKLINDEIKQYFSDIDDINFEIVEIKNKEEQTILENKMASKVFEMIDSLLFEIVLFRYPDGHGGFVINSHHIISDSWTNGIVANTVALIYSKLKNNEEYVFDNSLSYKNYIQAELDYINSSKFEKDKKYWDEVFTTVPEVATISSIKDNSKDQNDLTANRFLVTIDEKLLNSLKAYCEKNKVSLYNFFMSIFSLYLGRVSNLDEFVIGTPILNRTNFKEKQTTGMFINTLPLKINLSHDKTFLDNLKDIAITSMGLLRHQKYSFQYIIEDLRKKDSSLPKLYNVLYSYQITKMNENMDSLEHTTSWIFNKTIDDDLDIHMFEWNENNSIQIAYDYRTNMYDEQDIRDLHARILHVINQVLEKEDILLKDIEIVTPEEKHEILYEFNNTNVYYPKDKTIVDLFEEQVEKTPDNIAISFEGTEITYKDLDLKSDNMARTLIKHGVKRSDIVGILLPRSLDLFISMIGILKTGAIYMPIDVEFPDTRIKYMINDSATKICITTEEHKNRISKNVKKITINDIINDSRTTFKKYNVNNSDGCYVIYTSGSTGNPKGVITTHNNVINYTYAFQNEFKLNKNDTVLQQFTPSFDAFVEEFYPALLNGVKIFAVSKDTICNFTKLQNFINDNKITLISCSPLLLNELNKLKRLNSVKTFISGGDVLKKEFYSNLIKYANVYNTYGPTETTVCSTYHKCNGEEIGIIPIGKTIANYKNYIVSNSNNLLPKGYVGELCIGGSGVSLGYLNNKELTKEKFITLFGEKVYKTGDLCRINKDNEIEFLGRKDKQLKIRGYRVSLGEIEKMINQYPGISNSLVIDFTDEKNNKKLCAYYIGLANITTKEIKEYLEKVLPVYMIPSLYIRIDNIPININGKVDKSKLPNASSIYEKRSSIYIKPVTETEKKLESIWKNILGLNRVSINDNLFELGADSLSIIDFQTSIVNENWNIGAQDIYIYTSIKKLAERIETNHKNQSISNEKYSLIDLSNISLKNKQNNSKNILLTGATGFFGIHILNTLLESTNSTIYCIVRGKNDIFAKKRLIELYDFYFNKNLLEKKGRLNIIYGDITKEKFNIDDIEYKKLLNNIDLVIHSAATVKHYGNENLFQEINVIGTRNIIKFCLDSNSELHHISTISVSGQFSNQSTFFTENDFYIGQNYSDNVYIKSKFQAEYYILQSIKTDNLYAKIYRIGNLTGRYSDGLFQKNIDSNAFYKKLQKIIEIKKIPDEIKNIKIDFTPVDFASDAIKKLIFEDSSGQIIYHLYNNNILSVEKLVSLLNEIGIAIRIVPKEDFLEEKEKRELNKLIYDIYPTVNKENIVITNNITIEILSKLEFNWKRIDKEYLSKIINYMYKINFLEEGENFE